MSKVEPLNERGLYLDLRRLETGAGAPGIRPDQDGLWVSRWHRLHTVFRTLEHLGWLERLKETPAEDEDRETGAILWGFTSLGWGQYRGLRERYGP